MIDENGVSIIEDGDDIPDIPGDLSTDIRVASPFGFKVVEIDGEKVWAAATEQDYREAEAARQRTTPDNVVVNTACYNIGPKRCTGSCSGLRRCVLAYFPSTGLYYCVCR